MEEVWKVVEGFGGIYSVSSFGRVRSKERTQLYEDGRLFHYPEKVLKQSTPKSGKRVGYMTAHFYYNGTRETMCVHRLVATYQLRPSQKVKMLLITRTEISQITTTQILSG